MTRHLDALTLNAWADGLLAPEERRPAAAHLAECGLCRARAAGQSQMAQLLMRLPREAPPPLLTQAILAAVTRPGRRPAWRPSVAAISGAAALLGLALVVLAWPDVAQLLPALANAGAQGTDLLALLNLPGATVGAVASSTFDWASVLTSGAGVALMTGLVLLAGAAFGGLAQLLQPGAEQAAHPAGGH